MKSCFALLTAISMGFISGCTHAPTEELPTNFTNSSSEAATSSVTTSLSNLSSENSLSWEIYKNPLGVSIEYPSRLWTNKGWYKTIIVETADGFIIQTEPRRDINYWQIHIASASDSDSIRKAISRINEFKSCPIRIGDFNKDNVAKINIVNTVETLGDYKEGECWAGFAYQIFFNRKLNKLAFWIMGQEAIYDAPDGQNYDGQMVESFKFIEN